MTSAQTADPEPGKPASRIERTIPVDLGPEIRAAYATAGETEETLFSPGQPMKPAYVETFYDVDIWREPAETQIAQESLEPRNDSRFSLAARAGTMIPVPWIEQAAFAASVDFGYALLPFLWLEAELGFERSTANDLSQSFDLPFGRLLTTAEFHQWSLPILLGARVSLADLWFKQQPKLELSAALQVGLVYQHATFEANTPSGPFVNDKESGLAPMVSARVEGGWRVGPGAIVVSAAWRQDLMWDESDTAKRESTGLNLEAGWRHFF